jgi:single-stranded DNA-binding protein
MSITLSGEVIEIFPTKQITDKFMKREFVVKTTENEDYPEFLPIEVIQDKCNHLDYIKKGDKVDVSVNVKGRPWTNPKTKEERYFLSLQAWKIEKADAVTHSITEDTIEDNQPLPF